MINLLTDKLEAESYLMKEQYKNLNAINYLRNYETAQVYVYENDINHGIAVYHDYGRNFLATKNEKFLAEFWEMLPPGHHFFSGIPNEIAELFLKGRKAEWRSPCKCYAVIGEFTHEVSSEYVCERLKPEDAGEVDEYYTYRHDDSLERIRNDITNLDSACVRIDGELAAWCLVHGDDGSLGPLYTKDKFRKRGLAELVSTVLIKKLVAKNVIPYVHIVEENTPSLGLAAKFAGMEFTHDCLWFGVVK